MATKEGKSKFTLPNKKVYVKPIVREGEWLPKNHSGAWMYDNTKLVVQVPLDEKTGTIVNPLNEEEQEFFENKKISGMDFGPGDLNPYRETNNYWKNTEVFINKSDTEVGNETVLTMFDLKNPRDYINYAILKANTRTTGGIVAPSWDQRFHSGTYRVALVEEGFEEGVESIKAEKTLTAWKFFETIKDSPTKMYDFLSVYYLENKDARKPPQDGSKEWYMGEIKKIIDTNLDKFLVLVEDESFYKSKLDVSRGLKVGAVSFVNGRFELPGGKPIGGSLTEAVKFFMDDKNHEELLRLKATIEG